MTQTQAIVKGTLNADGTLALDEKPDLPPGRVWVTISVETTPAEPKEDTWALLEKIWKEQESRGFKGRSKEEIDAEVAALRYELDHRLDEIDRIRDETRRTKENTDC